MKSPLLPRLAFSAAMLLPAFAAAAPGATVTTPQVRAELVAQAPDGLVAGRTIQLGLLIQHQPHWHTYWKNPGDSGLPTTLQWNLPAGVVAGEIAWPTPQRLPVGPLLNYGYEGQLLLPVQVLLPAGFRGDALKVGLHADWLVCNDVCIPQGGDFAIEVPAQAATAGHAEQFAAALQAVPQPLATARAQARAKAGAGADAGELTIEVSGLPAAWRGQSLQVFPELPGVIDNPAPARASWLGAAWSVRLRLDPQRTAAPALLPVVLAAPGSATALPGSIALPVPVTPPWPAGAAVPPPLPALNDGGPSAAPANAAPATASGGNPTAAIGFGLACLLALGGGALLNLMPCVFPVLSLKVLGFARHADQRRALRLGGLAYTAGVVLSFVALAGLLLALRAGGEQLGWGFQLQSPVVVAVLAALFTLIGLNLAGVFEFGSVLPSAWAAAQARHPVVDAALTGMLAVAVASPCTAPFMGASLGVALTLPPAQALAIFAALGLGMALPYLAASLWPGLARLLPRPGVWMAHLRTLMAFPMLATVVWLVWVLGQQVGIDGAAALLLLLLALAFVAWALGSPSLGPLARRGFGATALALLVAALFWAGPALRDGAGAVARTSGDAGESVGSGANGDAAPGPADRWQAWSAERVAQARAEGRPVFVDFTAAWCVTCQFNKRSTLHDAAVMADFDAHRVLLLRADWTRRDAAISAQIARLGRSGVPVYALYAPGEEPPRLLNEILSPAEVRTALAALPAR